MEVESQVRFKKEKKEIFHVSWKKKLFAQIGGGPLLGVLHRSQKALALEKTPKEIKDQFENKKKRLKLYLVVV